MSKFKKLGIHTGRILGSLFSLVSAVLLRFLCLLMTLHTMPMPNHPQSLSPCHNRMQLNNWLQGHGGTRRLAWNNYIVSGPRHRPNWHSECFVDGTLFGQGYGSSKGGAQEVAAGMTLANLLSSYEAASPS